MKNECLKLEIRNWKFDGTLIGLKKLIGTDRKV